MKNFPITKNNLIYAFSEINFTHDHSTVKVGSIMLNRNGIAHTVTKVDKDECGRRQFWADNKCLGVQYDNYHNMLTKSPFYAHEFKTDNDNK